MDDAPGGALTWRPGRLPSRAGRQHDGCARNVMKYLLLLLVLGLLWVSWKKRQVPPAPPRAPEKPISAMLLCAHCGVHFPEGEGVAAGGQTFCSSAHSEAFQRR